VRARLAPIAVLLAVLVGAAGALLGTCGPFTDAAADAFCPFVLEIFYLGITTGTTATTYDPAGTVTRLQMAAFLSRSVDGALQRSGRRALSRKFWTPQSAQVLGLTTLPSFGGQAVYAQSDGRDVWVSNTNDGRVFRVRASDGLLLETWVAANAWAIAVAMGRVFVTSSSGGPSLLYQIDPAQPPGFATTVASSLPVQALGITFDGGRIWTANLSAPASVSIVTPQSSLPWTVTTVTAGFTGPESVVFDGSNVWAVDTFGSSLKKLNGQGAILQTVTVGVAPHEAIYDGANFWVANANSIAVVRGSTGTVLATLTGNGLNAPLSAAFDGTRFLATNSSGDSISLWKAADLTPLGSFPMPPSSAPAGACSDGLDFWIVLQSANKLARF
jgi:hypothetical protein